MKMRGLYSVHPLSLDGVNTALRMEGCVLKHSTELLPGGGRGHSTQASCKNVQVPIKPPHWHSQPSTCQFAKHILLSVCPHIQKVQKHYIIILKSK